MRAGLVDLGVPLPLGERLPGVYVEDMFTQRFTAALDEVIAPVFATLDCFAAYLDPRLAPADFVDWLAGWVALDVDENWSPGRRRALVSCAVTLHRLRGTRRGLAEHVRLLTGGEVDVLDSGGCAPSNEPGAALPGADPARVTVRVRVPEPGAVDRARLTAAVARMVPAHVVVTIEVTT